MGHRNRRWGWMVAGGTLLQFTACLDDLVQPVLLDIGVATLLAALLGQPVI